MKNGALVICSSATLLSGTSTTEVKGWTGGRASLAVMATVFPTTALHLEYRNLIGGGWIRAHTSAITTNALISLDAPAGEYRINAIGSTALGVSAVLIGIGY